METDERSNDAYKSVRDRGRDKSLWIQILHALVEGGPGTAREVAGRMGDDQQSLTPRFNELVMRGLVVNEGESENVATGEDATIRKATPEAELYLRGEYKPISLAEAKRRHRAANPPKAAIKERERTTRILEQEMEKARTLGLMREAIILQRLINKIKEDSDYAS